MRELWEKPDCDMSKDESLRIISDREEANRRTSKSDKELVNICSAKRSDGTQGRSKPAYEEEDHEDWSGQYE